MSDTIEQPEPPDAEIPGSRPLRKPSHELFARARSLLLPLVEAYRQAGLGGQDYAADRGNGAKLDRRADIRERVTFLTRQPEERLKEKRERIESFLWAVHETNYADFWETVEEEERDEDDEPTGRMVKRQKVRMFSALTDEQQRMIESLKFTEKGRPILSVYSKMQSNMELRKLLGIGSATKESGGGEFDRMADSELLSELHRQARELGIDVDLTYRIRGEAA